MLDNVVRFFFLKTNGEEREAFGTLNAQYIEQMCGPKKEDSKNKRPDDPSIFHYFDVNAENANGGEVLGGASAGNAFLVSIRDILTTKSI